MDFTNVSKSELGRMLIVVQREIIWAKMDGRPTNELKKKYEAIKTELRKRMG